MDNNDRLIRIRYALEIKNSEMVEIFKLGGVNVTKEEVIKMLTKSKDSDYEDTEIDGELAETLDNINFDNSRLEAFLNGFIIYKRGRQDSRPDPEPEQPKNSTRAIEDNESVNNIILKKLKIALSLTSEDMLDIFEEAGVYISKSELGALLRKEGHKHYRECGDRYARNFLKGLGMRYRD